MNHLRKTQLIIIGLLVLFLAACGADPAAKLNNEGNSAYDEQAYLEALELYQNAQIEHPELAEPYYNAANAFYRAGDYEQALAQMEQALLYADVNLAQHSYFNLGNNLFNAQQMETAVAAYIQALLLNPDDADAKYNLELALATQQQQEQEQQQQEQQQEQNQDQQDQQDGEGEESPEQQEGQEGENGEQPQDQQGDQQQPEEQPGENGEPQNEEGDEAQNEQSQLGEDGEPQDGTPQNGEPQNGEEQDGQPNGTMAGLQPGERLSEEQAKQLLAAIAGNAQTLQEKLGQILVVPGPPPAQDW
jgi:tetratricopeptide (TPR) repeat protein